VPKHKIRTNAQALKVSNRDQVADKNFPGCSLSALSKWSKSKVSAPERFNDPKLLRQRINQGWHPIWRHYCARMSIERYSERHGIVLARIPDGLPDDC